MKQALIISSILAALLTVNAFNIPHRLKWTNEIGDCCAWAKGTLPAGTHKIGLKKKLTTRPCLRGGGGAELQPSFRQLFEEGTSVEVEELLKASFWEGFVPFPGPADRGTSYCRAQLIMATLAKISGWAGRAGKSFWRSPSNPGVIEAQALEMKIVIPSISLEYSLGFLGSACVVQQTFALPSRNAARHSPPVTSAIVEYSISSRIRDVLRKNPVDGSLIGLLSIQGKEIGYFRLVARKSS